MGFVRGNRKKLSVISAVAAAGLFAAAVLGIIGTGCRQNPKNQPRIKMSKVERGDLSQTVVATGRIQPLHQIEIRSKSGGTVRAIYVEEGDFVTKGQKLMDISPEASPTEQVRARQELNTSEVEVKAAEDRLRIARELFEKKLVPEQDYLEAQRDLERAQARLAAAEAEWALIQRERIGYDGEGSDFVRTSTTVVAPISGLIFVRNVDVGASVTPTTSASGGTVVMTMGDDSEIEFRGDIDEADIGKMQVGLGVRLSVQAHPGRFFRGKVTHISPVGRVDQDEQQTVFGVRAQIDNPEKLLRVGLTATARVVVDERKDVPIVDEMALNFRGDSTFVNLITDTATTATVERFIEVGISDGIRSEVTAGLEGGEFVSLGSIVRKDEE